MTTKTKALCLVLCLLCFISFTAACASDPALPNDDGAATKGPSPQGSQAEGTAFAFPYKFSAEDLYGNTVTEESLGEKELFFVHYWATWCGPCVREMPDLARVAEEYGDRVGFFALLDDYGTARETALQIAESSGISFIMVDAKTKELQSLLKKVQSGYIPTTILIDSDGNMVGEQLVGSYGSGYSPYIDDALKNDK